MAKRLSLLKKAIPKWADFKKMNEIYKSADGEFHVDHIIPLTSKYVSGLHTEDNLQLLPAKDNIVKGNRYWPDMPVIDKELKSLAERYYNEL